MKRCFIDTETTGINPKTNGIWQVGGLVAIDKKIVHRFLHTFLPHEGAVWDQVAREMVPPDILHKIDHKELPESREAFLDFKASVNYVNPRDKVDKFFFIGYNAYFDWQFLQEWFLRNDDKYFGSLFAYPPIDVACLAAECLGEERLRMPNFKLHTVAARFGIQVKEQNLHNAAYDAELTKDIYCRIKSLEKEPVKIEK